jgi:hypothetical protein
MKFFEKHPAVMVVIGVMGISLSSIFVKYSQAPSAVTAAWRLWWTVLLLTPVALRSRTRQEFRGIGKKMLCGGEKGKSVQKPLGLHPESDGKKIGLPASLKILFQRLAPYCK